MQSTAIPDDSLSRVDREILRRFEDAWRGAGRPELSDFLPIAPSPPARMLTELVHLDLDFRLRRGEPARVEDYLGRHPILERDRSVLLELIGAEFDLRRHWEGPAAAEDYMGRFPHLRDELLARLEGRSDASTMPGGMSRSETSRDDPPIIPGFEIRGELGRGGMGVVYLAHQAIPDRVVALKTIAPGRGATAEEFDRFRREAQAMARLDHPNIVPVYEVGEHGGLPYFTSRFYPGGSLARGASGARPDFRTIARRMEAVAIAVHHAHRRGVLHRDLKPSNILLDESGLPHVADFGLAKRLDEDATACSGSGIVGTPCYIAPEQAQGGRAVTTSSDVYGLGAILFELLTGRPPFRAETPMATMLQVIEKPPRPPSEFEPSVPADLETICLKCLEKEPSRRYPSAQVLAEELGRWLRGEPILGRPLGLLGRGRRWCGRNPVLALLILAVAMTAISGTAGVSFLAIEAHRQRREALRNAILAIDESRSASRHLYRAEVQLAQNAWTQGQFGQMQELLEKQIPRGGREDLRGFEWHYLRRLARGDLALEHSSEVTCLAIDADGRRIASGDSGGVVKVWDAGTGRELLRISGHDGGVSSVAFSPDGEVLASSRGAYHQAGPGEAKLWDLRTGRTRGTLGKGRGIAHLAFSPDGKRLFTGGWKEVAAWDIADHRKVRTFEGHEGVIPCLALSPDGSRLAAGGARLDVWDASTGEIRLARKGERGPIAVVAFSRDGRLLATGGCCPGDFGVTIRDATTGERKSSGAAHAAAVTGLTFHPDGSRLISSGEDGSLKLTDVDRGREVAFSAGHAGPVTATAHDPRGRWLASSGSDRTVRVWDLARDREAQTFDAHEGRVSGIAFSPDGRMIASGTGAQVREGRESDKPGGLRLWDAETGRLLVEFAGHPAPITGLAFHPGGDRLASAGLDRSIKIWDVRSGEVLLSIGCPAEVTAVAFSPDGTRIVAGMGGAFRDSAAGGVLVWESSSGRLLRDLRPGLRGIRCVAFSPDGRKLAAGGVDGSIHVWDAKTWRTDLECGGPSPRIQAIAFGADGRSLAVGGPGRATELRDSGDGRTLIALDDRFGGARGLAFIPDGHRLFSVGDDGRTLKIWDGRSGQLILNLRGRQSGISAFTVDRAGRRIACGGEDGTITIRESTR